MRSSDSRENGDRKDLCWCFVCDTHCIGGLSNAAGSCSLSLFVLFVNLLFDGFYRTMSDKVDSLQCCIGVNSINEIILRGATSTTSTLTTFRLPAAPLPHKSGASWQLQHAGAQEKCEQSYKLTAYALIPNWRRLPGGHLSLLLALDEC